MSAGFSYLDGQLHADRVPLAEIAAAVDTPAYISVYAFPSVASQSCPSPAYRCAR